METAVIGVLVAVGGLLITIYKIVREQSNERARLSAALDHVGESLAKLDKTVGKVLERLHSLEVKVAVLEERVG